MKKLGNLLIIILFLGFIIGIGSLIQISPDQPVSFHENRALAQKPPFTPENVISGEYTKQFDAYFIDQFFSRDFWMESYLKWQQLTNQTFLFKYFISEDNWIYPKPLDFFAQSSIDKSTQSLQELVNDMEEREIELYFFSLPGRANALTAPFPAYVKEGFDAASKDYFMERLPQDGLTIVNMGEIFKKRYDETEMKNLYFQTDHHWNINGAFKGYEIIYNTLRDVSAHFQGPSFNPNDYTKKCFDKEKFLGSYNKQLYRLVDQTIDQPCQMLPKHFDYSQLEVYVGEIIPETRIAWNSIYGKELHKGNDEVEYSGIYTGDYREINIINPLKEAEATKVLFVKDSYANPLTLLLAENFYQTTFFDIRYNNDRSLYDFIGANDFDIIAILYNDETLFSSMYNFKLKDNQ